MLLHHAHHIAHTPMFHELAVGNAHDIDDINGYALTAQKKIPIILILIVNNFEEF